MFWKQLGSGFKIAILANGGPLMLKKIMVSFIAVSMMPQDGSRYVQ
jgi:hypothetical protein